MGKNNILLVIFLVVFISILIYKRILRKQAFKNRKPLTFEEIYNIYIKDHKIGYDTFVEVYKVLSDAYSVDPHLIRPTDRIKMFQDIDSWDLDKGSDKIEEWLSKTFKIEKLPKKLKTILDILIIVESSGK